MHSDSFSDADAAAVFDFLNDYWDDVDGGGARPLGEYLARYPDAQEAIAAEYLRLRREARGAAGVPADGAEDPLAESSAPDDGERVGPYRVVRELGQGGQGRVVLAEDSRIQRRVALKILDGFFVTEDRRQRFRREAEVIARLSHPGICSIHEADIDGDVPYIAMQFVEGEVLSVALERARKNVREGGAEKSVFVQLPWIPRTRQEVHRVLAFFERAARALHAAHEAGVVHRDIKPANIAIDSDAQPVLLDFGLAADEASKAPGLTRTGDVFGTPAYMSPEQLRGERHAIDRATDVYSLGASLYEALVGERPFQGEGRFALERAILSAPLRDPRGANRALGEDVKVVLETALERDLRRRYSTALEFAEDLRRIREYEPIRARPAGPWLHLRRWARRQPALAAVLVTSFVLLSGALVHARILLSREQRANRFALGRHLAERSTKLLEEEPAEALLIATRAVELAPGYLTRSALYAPLEACFLRRVLEPGEPVGRAWDLALAPDGTRVAIALANGQIQVWPAHAAGSPQRAAEPGKGGGAASPAASGRSSGPAILASPGEASAVRSLDFRPDGAELVASHDSGRVVVWDLAGGHPRASVELAGPVLWVEYDRDGARIVVQPAERPAAIFDADLAPVCQLATEPLASGCARFSADGRLVMTSSRSWQGLPLTGASYVTLWDARTGELVQRLGRGGDGDPGAAVDAQVTLAPTVQWSELTPAGDRVVAAFDDGVVRIWDAETGRAIGADLEHEGSVLCASFDPTGGKLATTTDHGTTSTARVWDIATSESIELAAHDGERIVHAAFDPSGTTVATASFDRTVRLFDATTGALKRTLRARFRPLRIVWASDGRSLFTLSNSSDVHVWSTGSMPHVYRLEGHGAGVAWASFDHSGTRALTASEDGTLRLWATPASGAGPGRVEPGSALATWRAGSALRGAALHPRLERLLAWYADGRVAVWDYLAPDPEATWLNHPAPVTRAAFAPASGASAASNGDGLAPPCAVGTVDAQGVGRLWRDGKEAIELAGACTGLAFDAEGRFLAVYSGANEVRILDAQDASEQATFTFDPSTPGADGVRHVAFRPGHDELAIACADGRVRFADPADGSEVRASRAMFRLYELEYSPDGARLLVLGDAGGASLRILEVEGDPAAFGVQAQVTHKSRIMSATFDASGEFVLTASVDGTAFVFSSVDGEVFSQHALHSGRLAWGAFSPRGAGAAEAGELRAITASADGTAAVWPVDPYPAALSRLPRELYPWEWAREMALSQPPE